MDQNWREDGSRFRYLTANCCERYFAPLGWYQRAHQISRLPGTSYQSRHGHVPPCLLALSGLAVGNHTLSPPHTKCHTPNKQRPSPFPASASSRDHQVTWPGLAAPLGVALLQCALTFACITVPSPFLASIRQSPPCCYLCLVFRMLPSFPHKVRYRRLKLFLRCLDLESRQGMDNVAGKMQPRRVASLCGVLVCAVDGSKSLQPSRSLLRGPLDLRASATQSDFGCQGNTKQHTRSGWMSFFISILDCPYLGR